MGDPFETLYVTPDAPPEVISAAYRALAKLHHPDTSGAPPQRMAALTAAYKLLADPARRSELARQRMSERRVPPAVDVRMTFGKHKGMRLGEIPSDYLKWLVGNLTRQTNLREDARAVLAWRRGMP